MIPIVQAQQVLRDFSISTTPVLSINQIFEHNNTMYDEMDYGNSNYMGSLIRAEGKTFILVNTDIKNAGFSEWIGVVITQIGKFRLHSGYCRKIELKGIRAFGSYCYKKRQRHINLVV